MDLQQTIQTARAAILAGKVIEQIKSDDGHLVRAQLTQQRMSATRQVRVHVWDASGRLLKKEELPQ